MRERAWRLSEEAGELALSLELLEIAASADGLALDVDLRR